MNWQRISRRSERYSSLAFRADSRILVGGLFGGSVRWWQVDDGSPLRIVMYQRQPLWSVALSADGQLAAGGLADGTVALWRLDSAEPAHYLPGPPTAVVVGLQFVAGGDQLLAWTDARLSLWSIPTGMQLWTYTSAAGGLATITVAPDAQTVAVGGWDGRVELRRVADGALLHLLPTGDVRAGCLAFAPDSRLLAVAAPHAVQLWQVDDGQVVATLPVGAAATRCLAFAPDSRLLAQGDAAGVVRLAAVTAERWSAVAPATGTPLHSLHFLAGGQGLITVTLDGHIQMWGVAGDQQIPLPHHFAPPTPESYLRQVVLSPDRTALAMIDIDNAAWLWRIPPFATTIVWPTPPGSN